MLIMWHSFVFCFILKFPSYQQHMYCIFYISPHLSEFLKFRFPTFHLFFKHMTFHDFFCLTCQFNSLLLITTFISLLCIPGPCFGRRRLDSCFKISRSSTLCFMIKVENEFSENSNTVLKCVHGFHWIQRWQKRAGKKPGAKSFYGEV